MELEQPIFRSVQQAVHFSFFFLSLPPSQPSQMQTIYRQGGKRVTQSDDHYEPPTIHFGDLDQMDRRAQCAMVCAAVYDHLDAHERNAILARFAYQVEKARGVRATRDYCLPLLTCGDDMATLAMAWAVFGDEDQRAGLTIRGIAGEFDLKVSAVNDDIQRIKKTARHLEARAFDRLAQQFAGSGLVEQF